MLCGFGHAASLQYFSVYEQEKNRINKDGEIVISSTKTRTQTLVSALFSILLPLLPICC